MSTSKVCALGILVEHMHRRSFLIGGLATVWVSPAISQGVRLIGYLFGQHRPKSFADHSLVRALLALGHVEGRHYQVDWRYAEGQREAFSDLANDLVKSNPDAIVATTQLAVRAYNEQQPQSLSLWPSQMTQSRWG